MTVLDCTSSRNGGHGIEVLGNSTLSRCAVSRNDLGGIRESLGGSGISECVATNNPGNGIAVGTGSSVQNCTARGNLGAGIVAVSACHLVGNKCDANQTGIRLFDPDTANATGNRIDSNSCSSNQTGISVEGLFNLTIRNRANANSGANYAIQGSFFNKTGPIVTAGGTISEMSPWANFE